ncbi:MAG: glycosyltransferase [Oscillospiraceae bacterium]|nr:glycosyltransferase [Oscillospiraceae bacterium]
MNVIFISATCARPDYEDICKKRKRPMLDSSQKFFEMFLNGLAQQPDVTVDCITLRPISRRTYPGFYIPGGCTEQRNIRYHYVPIWNLTGLKTTMGTVAIWGKLKALLQQYIDKDVRILCDPLLLEGLLPAVSLGKWHGIMTVGFLTDMPEFANEFDEHNPLKAWLYRLYNRRVRTCLKKLDRYIVLTEAMSCVAENKPWILLDCIVDETMLDGLTPLEHTDDLPHVLYAGKLHKEFGLDILTQAIPLVKQPCVFDIYGDGNHKKALLELAAMQDNVRIHGIVPLKKVLEAELSASILVNPRTSAGEFTKYSFPSKTAEYMLAGVPLVMFRLPGISAQYEQYLQYAEQETPESFAGKIDAVLQMDFQERKQLAAAGKSFVQKAKNNFAQAENIVAFIRQ